jgi:hypothetical protein
MRKKQELSEDQQIVDAKVQAAVEALNEMLWLASVSGLRVSVTQTVQSSDMDPERTRFDLELVPYPAPFGTVEARRRVG